MFWQQDVMWILCCCVCLCIFVRSEIIFEVDIWKRCFIGERYLLPPSGHNVSSHPQAQPDTHALKPPCHEIPWFFFFNQYFVITALLPIELSSDHLCTSSFLAVFEIADLPVWYQSHWNHLPSSFLMLRINFSTTTSTWLIGWSCCYDWLIRHLC